jgi:hypothetical protein
MRSVKMVLVVGAAAVALTTAACVPLDETTGSTTTVNEFLPPPTTVPATTTTLYVPPPTINDDAIAALSMDMAWDDMDYETRSQVCDGVELFGLSTAAQMVNKGAGYEFDQDQVEAFLLRKC